MITFNNLSVRIDKSLCLSDVSGHFKKNTLTTILGPNGAGKTTLLRALSGLQPISNGTIHIDRLDARTLTLKNLSQKRSILPADPHICAHLRVREMLSMSKKNPQDIMDRLNITPLRHRIFTTLSTGEKTRILLALTYLEDTPIWFLDEPLAHLDPAYQCQILEFLEEMKAHKTIIMTLHDLNISQRCADHIYLLKDGQTIAAGSATTTLTNAHIGACFHLSTAQQTGLGLKIPQNKNTKNNPIYGKGRQGKFTQPPHQ